MIKVLFVEIVSSTKQSSGPKTSKRFHSVKRVKAFGGLLRELLQAAVGEQTVKREYGGGNADVGGGEGVDFNERFKFGLVVGDFEEGGAAGKIVEGKMSTRITRKDAEK